MRRASCWQVLLSAVVMGSVGSSASASEADQIDRGRRLAETLCAHCHMAPRQGEKQTRTEVPGFAAVANRPGQTEAEIVRWLRSKPQAMPDHRLTYDEAVALAAFIMSLRVTP